MISLSSIFRQLVAPYCANEQGINNLWVEIEIYYSSKNRHYHTLLHLQNMYNQLLPVKEQINDWNTLLFSLFYHDIIYKATSKDNEEKSAAFAQKRLQQINYPQEEIQLCFQQIITTKSHTISDNSDTNFFTDADLSILGANWPDYEAYTKAIRKEYAIYPDLMYKPGRRKVLQHFLAMEKIYKTGHFHGMYEAQARENIKEELTQL